MDAVYIILSSGKHHLLHSIQFYIIMDFYFHCDLSVW
uniref:Uncharacterized protein n=1 Tax=Rhizophora mucronata TaxID=61149 RepID=A0A2P2PI86_RHIMU